MPFDKTVKAVSIKVIASNDWDRSIVLAYYDNKLIRAEMFVIEDFEYDETFDSSIYDELCESCEELADNYVEEHTVVVQRHEFEYIDTVVDYCDIPKYHNMLQEK